MAAELTLFTVTVLDYDQAIAFYVAKLGFELIEDTDLGGGKRWVRVRPAGSTGAGFLLARAASETQRASVGNQTGGRVLGFVETDDFARDHQALLARGVRFVRGPVEESYGTVAVFEDLYGNRFDLIEPKGMRTLLERLALPPPAAIEANVQLLDQTDAWVLKRIEYRGDEDDPISAFLFLPTGRGPFPGVLAYHQHNSEWHLGKSEVAGLAGDPMQAFAPALARRGVAVLAPDAITFEERRKSGRGIEPHSRDWLEHYNEMAYRLVRGELLMRKLLADAMRAFSVLTAQPEIDAARVGVIGHSMGGMLALHHAAVDPRLAFVCASGSVCSIRSRMARGVGINMAELIPQAATRWTAADLVASAARRPFLVVSASADPYSADAEEIVRTARQTALQSGQPDRLEHLHAEGGHALDPARFDQVVEWLVKRASSN